MATKCEVFGWLLVDHAARVLVREESGHISLQSAKREVAPGDWPITVTRSGSPRKRSMFRWIHCRAAI